MQEYLNNIESVLLETFRVIMNNNNYKLLFIGDGDYDEVKAHEAWTLLYDEYNEFVKSKSVNLQFEITKQIHIQNNEYKRLKSYLFLIGEVHKFNLISGENLDLTEYVKEINYFGYAFDVKKDIGSELKRVDNQLRNYTTRIESDLLKIEKLNEESKDWTFDDTIEVVERDRKMPFLESATVKKFAVSLNMLIKTQSKSKDKKQK